MDTRRFEELKAKAAGETGLTLDEANELGRLYAEEAGEPYANAADTPPEDEDAPRGVDLEAVRREEESGTLDDRSRDAPTLRPAVPASMGEIQAEEDLDQQAERGSGEDVPAEPS